MKYNLTALFLFIFTFIALSQDVIEPSIATMEFLGRPPQKSIRNSLPDNLLRRLYYDIQPENFPKIGYLNTNGKIIIEPKFNMGSEFFNDHANIIKDSIYGYVNRAGEETYFKNYTDVFFYYGNTGIAKKKEMYGLINRKGDSLTSFKYKSISNFGFNYYLCQTENINGQILDENGKIIFNEDMKFYIHSNFISKDSIIIYSKNLNRGELSGLMNINGKIIIPPTYNSIYAIDDHELYVAEKNSKYGFINKFGEETIPVIYDRVKFNISDNLISVRKDDKWGFVNRKNEVIIPFQYEDAYSFTNGLAYVKKGKYYGFIDTKNKTKVPFNLDKTENFFFSEDLALIKSNDKYGFINKKGKIKIKAIYDKAFPFMNGLAYVGLNGKYGYIDKKGNEIIPIKYKQLWHESEGVIKFAE